MRYKKNSYKIERSVKKTKIEFRLAYFHRCENESTKYTIHSQNGRGVYN